MLNHLNKTGKSMSQWLSYKVVTIYRTDRKGKESINQRCSQEAHGTSIEAVELCSLGGRISKPLVVSSTTLACVEERHKKVIAEWN